MQRKVFQSMSSTGGLVVVANAYRSNSNQNTHTCSAAPKGLMRR